MILIKSLGGPLDKEVRTPPVGIQPLALLSGFVDCGWGWEIDFSQASREEVIAWGGAELLARAYRAVKNGKVVNFLGTEYTSVNELQTLEDDLVGSGWDICIASDDENGVQIDIVQPE